MQKLFLTLAVTFAGLLSQAEAVTARVMCAYTFRAASWYGGDAQVQSRIANNMGATDSIHSQSKTYVDWDISGWYKTGIADGNRDSGTTLNDLKAHSGIRTRARELSSNLVNLTADINRGGIADRPGQYSIVDAEAHNNFDVVYAHEIGHNYDAVHEHGLCDWVCNGAHHHTIMQWGYCWTAYHVRYYSNPLVFTLCRYIGDASHDNAKRINNIRNTRSNTWF